MMKHCSGKIPLIFFPSPPAPSKSHRAKQEQLHEYASHRNQPTELHHRNLSLHTQTQRPAGKALNSKNLARLRGTLPPCPRATSRRSTQPLGARVIPLVAISATLATGRTPLGVAKLGNLDSASLGRRDTFTSTLTSCRQDSFRHRPSTNDHLFRSTPSSVVFTIYSTSATLGCAIEILRSVRR